jgi:hypothetical protein
LPLTGAELYLRGTEHHAHHDPGKVGARGQQEVSPVTSIHTTMTGDQCAAFGMPFPADSAVARVRVSSLRALPLTDGVLAWGPVLATAAIADTKGDFPGFPAWSPPS